MDIPIKIYKGHTSAVLSLAWAPTGREFVTGSYDKTVRIFSLKEGTAREVYHTKRMQRVHTVQYTADNKFIITGSDDSNLRLWKAMASEQLGQLNAREERSMNYRSALVQRYKHLPEVKKIHRARKVPRAIRNETKQAIIQKESAEKKQANRVKYDRKGKYEFTPERKKVVVKEVN
uniref:Sof1-like protein domain-containing protein n=1 Tax=Entomoneis paludosa TaxID=265537 RepID=A0A7S2VDU6_9STRA